MASKDGRARNFATVVYPDSAPDNWLDIVSDLRIPVFVSPLHDQDHNPDGEVKKSHYHVLFTFEGVKTSDQVQAIIDSFGGVGCEKVASLRGYARYLCHLDNPEKFQYNVEHVKCFGGADYTSSIGLPTDKYKAIGEMIDWCEEQNIFSYSQLLSYARVEHFDWFRVLCDSGTMVMREYLKSRKWTADNMKDEMGE